MTQLCYSNDPFLTVYSYDSIGIPDSGASVNRGSTVYRLTLRRHCILATEVTAENTTWDV